MPPPNHPLTPPPTLHALTQGHRNTRIFCSKDHCYRIYGMFLHRLRERMHRKGRNQSVKREQKSICPPDHTFIATLAYANRRIAVLNAQENALGAPIVTHLGRHPENAETITASSWHPPAILSKSTSYSALCTGRDAWAPILCL